MKRIIEIDCPPELLIGLQLNAERFADYLKRQAAISLFKEGRISSGTAASWLDMPRAEFLHIAWEAGAVLLEDSSDDFTREMALL
jgi:predicted HTH domain antitoxin